MSNDDQDKLGLFLPAGTKVRLHSQTEDGLMSEFGVVVHCWVDEFMGAYECYVAFFGDELQAGNLSGNRTSLGISRFH